MITDAECFALEQPLKPRLIFPVSGVTFEGRQDALQALTSLHDRGWGLSNYNGGLELRPEPENKYDKYAIAVWAATAGGASQSVLKFDKLKPIGYVPKYCCPSCGVFIQVNKRQGRRGPDACHECGISFVSMRQHNLNVWITEVFVQKSKPLACGLVWVGQGSGGGSFGARIGLWWPREMGGLTCVGVNG